MGVDASAFETTSIYPVNRNRVHEYFFSISGTSESVKFMETVPPDMAPISTPPTLGNNSQNMLPISAGPLLTTPNITLPSHTEKLLLPYI
jgi:hypothetical protein